MKLKYMKRIEPGQLVTFKNVVYRAKRAQTMTESCIKCDLWEQCPECKHSFYCGWTTYFKRI